MAKPEKTKPSIKSTKESKSTTSTKVKDKEIKTVKKDIAEPLASASGTHPIEIKESGVEFLHGMFVCDKGLKIQRVTDLEYHFFGKDADGKPFEQDYTFDNKEKADKLWAELIEYKSGKVKIHSKEAAPVPNITVEEKETINHELNEFAFWFEKSFSMLPMYYMNNMTMAHLEDYVRKQDQKFSYSIIEDGGVYIEVRNEIGSVRVPADKGQYLNIK